MPCQLRCSCPLLLRPLLVEVLGQADYAATVLLDVKLCLVVQVVGACCLRREVFLAGDGTAGQQPADGVCHRGFPGSVAAINAAVSTLEINVHLFYPPEILQGKLQKLH